MHILVSLKKKECGSEVCCLVVPAGVQGTIPLGSYTVHWKRYGLSCRACWGAGNYTTWLIYCALEKVRVVLLLCLLGCKEPYHSAHILCIGKGTGCPGKKICPKGAGEGIS